MKRSEVEWGASICQSE